MKYLNVLFLGLIFSFVGCSSNQIASNSPEIDEKIVEKKENNELIGKWILEYIAPVHGKNIDELFRIQKPYLNFVDDSKVAGNNGCNNIAGVYKWIENTISFDTDNFRSTRMFCEGIDESIYSNALKAINHFAIIEEGSRLVLLTGDIVAMSFVRELEK